MLSRKSDLHQGGASNGRQQFAALMWVCPTEAGVDPYVWLEPNRQGRPAQCSVACVSIKHMKLNGSCCTNRQSA